MTFNHGVRSSTLRWSTKPVAKATGFSFFIDNNNSILYNKSSDILAANISKRRGLDYEKKI